jgi:hypothetical protein
MSGELGGRTPRRARGRPPPAARGRGLAPGRGGDVRPGLRPEDPPPHLGLRAPLPAADPDLGRLGADLHAEPARDPDDHPLRLRHGAGGGRAAPGRSTPPWRPSRWRSPSTTAPASCRSGRWGKVAENVLFDIREAMFGHLQQVSQSFMDRTEVGRLMSRLQGDVNAMQEFLETSVISVGDLVLLFGIVACMLWLDWQLGLLTLSILPVLFLVRIVWLPQGADRLHRRARDEFRHQRRAGRGDPRRAHRAGDDPPDRQRDLYADKAHGEPAHPPHRREVCAGAGAGGRHAHRPVDGGGRGGGRRDGARPDARRGRDGGLPVLHPALLRPGPVAHHAVFGDAARHGLGPAPDRGAGRPPHHHRRAGCRDPARRHPGLGRIPPRPLRLRPRPAGARGRELPGGAGPDRRARRPHGVGQVEHDGAPPPLLRRDGGRGAGGRPRRARISRPRSAARSRWCCRSRSCSPAR